MEVERRICCDNSGGRALEAEALALIQRSYRIEKAAREAQLTSEQRKNCC